MGNSSSVNVAKSIIDVYAKVSSEIIQNTKLTNNNSQIISISNVAGDVLISGNIFKQTANINMVALMDALSNQSAVEKITAEMEQKAKSIVSGFNFFSFSDAKTTVDNLVKNSVNLLSQIQQTCAAASNNIQSIEVDSIGGNVQFTNNSFEQVTAIFSFCALKAVSENQVVQEVQQKINQSTESELKGLDLMWVILLCIAIVIGPLIFGKQIVQSTFNNIFPIVAVVGAIFVALYFVTGSNYMKSYYYTKPYLDYCPATKDSSIQSNTTDLTEVVNNCLKSDSCQLVDIRLTENKKARAVPVVTYVEKRCFGDPLVEVDPASSFEKADITAIKFKNRYSWMLYVGLALVVAGILGFIVQRRNKAT